MNITLGISDLWIDGVCNECGSSVIEIIVKDFNVNPEECKNLEDIEYSDYMNMCSNKQCKHHKWHFVGSGETPEYYKHN